MGHWPIKDHVARLDIRYNSYCRSYGDEGESLRHFLSDYPVLGNARLMALSKQFLKNLKDISGYRMQ